MWSARRAGTASQARRRRNARLRYARRRLRRDPAAIARDEPLCTSVRDVIEAVRTMKDGEDLTARMKRMSKAERKDLLGRLEKEMKDAAKSLQFERAAELRDMIIELSAS